MYFREYFITHPMRVLLPKPKPSEEKYRPISFMNIDAQTDVQYNTIKLNSATYRKDSIVQLSDVYLSSAKFALTYQS